jgi:POT family proton-dependent oligopeptide transporter
VTKDGDVLGAATDRTPPAVEAADALEGPGIFGHPRGLPTLFLTELWERFSYYGMRAILVLFMTSPAVQGGLGFDTKRASSIYGWYTMAVYLAAVPGGWIADRWLGAWAAVLVGGIIIASGHFTMVFASLNTFYLGLVLITIGTGFLKPNISTMVGSLYREDDPRRDSGFSIFYMGINIGAVLAPLVCGFLAQSASFKGFLQARGFDPAASWHWGFGAAGVGMTLGLIIYLVNARRLRARRRPDASQKATKMEMHPPLNAGDWKRIAAICILFVFTILFWAAYEQKGVSLNLLARDLVRTEVFGWHYPSSFLQSATAAFVIILAPLFSILWVRLGDRQPSSPAKFTLGLFFIGLAYLLLVPACALTATGRISALWLIGVYFLEVVGEMCLSPVGLSTVTKLAPLKLVGVMMGLWFFATSLGNKLAGYLSGIYVPQSGTLMKLYGGIAAGLFVGTIVLALFTPQIKRLMGNVR